MSPLPSNVTHHDESGNGDAPPFNYGHRPSHGSGHYQSPSVPQLTLYPIWSTDTTAQIFPPNSIPGNPSAHVHRNTWSTSGHLSPAPWTWRAAPSTPTTPLSDKSCSPLTASPSTSFSSTSSGGSTMLSPGNSSPYDQTQHDLTDGFQGTIVSVPSTEEIQRDYTGTYGPQDAYLEGFLFQMELNDPSVGSNQVIMGNDEVALQSPVLIPSQPTLESPSFRSQVGTRAGWEAAQARRKKAGPDGQGKEFFCEHCQKGFTRRKNLTNHINSHFNIRPYQCEICGSAFVTNHVRKRHRDTKHRAIVVEGNILE